MPSVRSRHRVKQIKSHKSVSFVKEENKVI